MKRGALRKVLITGGPTWVKIDDLRIITNVFTGRTALFLAKKFKKKNFDVTLIINSHCIKNELPKNVKVVPFRYFEGLKTKIEKELKKDRYDLIIHSAAVSDYKLKKVFKGKVPSQQQEWTLELVPAPKLIKLIRKLARDSYLVQFKLEIKKDGLINKAFKSLKDNKADLVVANALEDLKLNYKAFIIDKNKNITAVSSKREFFSYLLKFFSAILK